MSYDTSGRKKATPSEQQSLLPDKLRTENVKIEGKLTKFQNNLRTLIQQKDEIGTQSDSNELRKRIDTKKKEMQAQADDLKNDITEYGNISVPYRSQRQQTEKQDAYSKRLNEIENKYKQEQQDIELKMQQHPVQNNGHRNSLTPGQDSTISLHQDESQEGLLQEQQLDLEELKVQGEAAYMEDVINQRQDELNDVEQLMTDINHIAKDINTKVHDQRSDLVEIDHNAGTALENAEEAEKNIEEAQDHQKSGGKCMYWTVGLVSIAALVTILIVVLKLV